MNAKIITRLHKTPARPFEGPWCTLFLHMPYAKVSTSGRRVRLDLTQYNAWCARPAA